MAAIASKLEQTLGKGGRIAAKMPAYEVRPQQLKMGEAVAATLDSGGRLLVEAGTGVGKSFAYLVPAIDHVLARGGRVVVSTHTIALQEQLIQKDIPFLQSVYPEEFQAALVKGRSNYLSLRRLERASSRREHLFATREDVQELWRIEDWAYKTDDGSLSDLEQMPSPAVWDRARSEFDDCMGRHCPNFNKCFYQRARRRAVSAQILVVNHALLFADLALRQQNASVLPDYEYLILDEGHTVESVAGDHVGITLADTQVRYLLGSLHNERTQRGILGDGKGASLIPVVRQAYRAAGGYFDALADWHAQAFGGRAGRLRSPPPIAQGASDVLLELGEGLRDVREHLMDDGDRLEFQAAADRCRAMAAGVSEWHEQNRDDWVYWVESGEGRRRATLCARPVDVGPFLEEMLYSRVKALVLTSATLTTGSNGFDYIKGRLRLEEARTLRLGSPFDYASQVRVYVESSMPDPSAADFLPAAARAIRKYVAMTNGHAFVLFTSYDMLKRCADELADFFALNQMPLLVQGSGLPRSVMLERFRSTPRSVLFGTDTFWTGVDVPGDALGNVIIVKLPFAVPNHPVVEARIEHIRAGGGNPFMEFQVPEAVLKFRQGIGRLIRTKTDRGIIVILDPRVVSKPYGRAFLAAIPECPVETGMADDE